MSVILVKCFEKLESSMINHNECARSKISMVGTYLCTEYLDSVNNFDIFSLKCVVALYFINVKNNNWEYHKTLINIKITIQVPNKTICGLCTHHLIESMQSMES